MYIDVIVLAVLVFIVILFFKRFSSFVIFMAIVDIFLRIVAYIKNNIGLRDVAQVIDKYLPESIFDIIENYTSSIPLLCTILKWAFVVLMIIFLGYLLKIFFRNKKL